MSEETSYSRNIAEFDGMTDRDDFPFFVKMRDKFEEMIENGRILDAGCGHGRDTDHFYKQGFDATGIDIGEKAVEYARDNYSGSFEQMDVTKLDYENNSFDGIWCTAVLQLLKDNQRIKAIREFKRVLKNDGVIFMTLKEGEGTQEKEKWEEHFTHFLMGEEEAREMIKEAGLKIVEQTSNTSGSNSFINFFCTPSDSK